MNYKIIQIIIKINKNYLNNNKWLTINNKLMIHNINNNIIKIIFDKYNHFNKYLVKIYMDNKLWDIMIL